MNNIKNVTEVNDCTACGACIYNCPKRIIVFHKNKRGFFAADIIDERKCINCGKCVSVCPRISPLSPSNALNSYYGWSNGWRNDGTSGGIASDFAETVVSSGGVAFGAKLDLEKYELKHAAVRNKEEVVKIAKSKYVQSDITGVKEQIEHFLGDNKKVLFVGTPCQVYGLRTYFGHNNENLLFVDFSCHGVPSNELFFDFLRDEEKNGKIIYYDFRSKKRGWTKATVELKKNGKRKTRIAAAEGYSSLFYDNLSLAKACYTCPFRGSFFSDITVADFWSYRDFIGELKDSDIKYGISWVLSHNEKAERFLNNIRGRAELRRVDNSKSRYLFSQITYPRNMIEENEKFYRLYESKGYPAIKKGYISFALLRYIKKKIRRLINVKTEDKNG